MKILTKPFSLDDIFPTQIFYSLIVSFLRFNHKRLDIIYSE